MAKKKSTSMKRSSVPSTAASRAKSNKRSAARRKKLGIKNPFEGSDTVGNKGKDGKRIK
jgi:hypothetical protein